LITVAIVLLVLMAAAITTARWFAPRVADYRNEVQGWVSQYLGQPVTIGDIGMVWYGWGPEVRLHQVRITQLDGATLEFDQAHVEFDLIEIFTTATFEPTAMSVVGTQLVVERSSDGSIALEGIEVSSESDISLGWLLSRDAIKLRNAELHWNDQQRGEQFVLSNINLSLATVDGHHRLHGSVKLPAELGEELSFAADLEGNVGVGSDWGGQLYLHAKGVESDSWLNELFPPWAELTGRSDLDLWSEWREGVLQQLSGSAELARLELSASNDAQQPAVGFDDIKGRFLWQRQSEGWRFDMDRFSLSRDGNAWPESGFSLSYAKGRDGVEVRGGFGWLRIDDLAVLTLHTPIIDTYLTQGVAGVAPKGDLRDLRFHFRQNRDDPQLDYRVDIDNLAISSWQGLPAFSGLSGSIQGDAGNGRLQLDSDKLNFEAQTLFRQPIQVDQLEGELVWQSFSDRLHVEASGFKLINSDLELEGRLGVDVPFDRATPPFLDLQIAFRDGRFEQISPYLPVGIMSDDVVNWLDRALVSGTIDSGSVLVHGPLNRFPFVHGDGRFEVVTNVSNGVLDYYPGWPRLEELDSRVIFDGHTMMIETLSGKTLNSEIGSTYVGISDLMKPVLMVDARAQGDLGGMLDYLHASPLASDYHDLLETIGGSGSAALDLSLQLPLYSGGGEATTAILLKLDQATLRAKRLGNELSEISGQLLFDPSGLSARGVKGRLLGRKVAVDVETTAQSESRVTFKGAFAIDELPLAAALSPYLSGETAWHADLFLPHKGSGKEGRVRLESMLDGVTVRLPPPFGKQRSAKQRFVAELLLGGRSRALSIDYGSVASARLELRALSDGFQMERGTLHLGSGKAPPFKGKGLFLSGQLEQFNLDSWLERFRAGGNGGSPSPPGIISGIDMDFDTFRGFGRDFHDLKIALEGMQGEWLLRAESQELKGSVEIPKSPRRDEVLMVELEYLKLAGFEEGREKEIPDPRRIPALQVNCGQLVFSGVDFGEMSMRVEPIEGGLRLRRLDLHSEVQQLHASGDWILSEGGHRSAFKFDLRGDDVGKVLKAWGYAVNMEEGELRARVNAAWDGAPGQFSLERMEGTLGIKIFDGRLLDIEPGVGRVFGLLSLQTLPRWLTLDFADLFKKGFSYENIKGDFKLKGGMAHTENLRMDGASAKIEISGRVGLKQHDYDQLVTVTPKLTASLPVAGALAGGPAAGAVLWVADKLFGKKVNKLSSTQYSVVGSWEEPVVTRLGKKAEVEARE